MSNENSANTTSIVSKVRAFCNTLRDDGVGREIGIIKFFAIEYRLLTVSYFIAHLNFKFV